MCGITGYVGLPDRSKNPRAQELTYQLITQLMKLTVVRGGHSTGVYSILPPDEPGKPDSVLIYKIDAPSTQAVGTDTYKKLKDRGTGRLFLGHCRWATHGDCKEHINNHPHLSSDNRMALVHNGVISGYEALKKRFPVEGECDSEVILRIIETEEDPIVGIQKAFDQTSGSMACFLSKYDKATRQATFYAFRNAGNPLVCLDLTAELGCIFFASTKDIMEKALKQSAMPAAFRKKLIVDVPDHEVWVINTEELVIHKHTMTKFVPATATGGGFQTSYPLARSGATSTTIGTHSRTTSTGSVHPSCSQTQTEIDFADDDTTDNRHKTYQLLDTLLDNLSTLDAMLQSGELDLDEVQDAVTDMCFDSEQLVNPQVEFEDPEDEEDETRALAVV